MFSMPVLVTMSIAATRMYRSLADFLCSTDVVDSGNNPRIGPTVPNSKSTITMPATPRQVEVAVHTAHEKYPSSLTDENTLYIGGIIPDSPSATNQSA